MQPKIGSWEWWNRDVDTPPVSEKNGNGKSPTRQMTRPGYVYYLGDGNGNVKIGFSKNPWSRTLESKVWCPSSELLAVEKGPQSLEYERHQQFKDEHLMREWFKLSDRLLDWIEVVKRGEKEVDRPKMEKLREETGFIILDRELK